MNKKSRFPRQNVTGNKVLGLDSCDHSNRSSEKYVKVKKNLEKKRPKTLEIYPCSKLGPQKKMLLKMLFLILCTNVQCSMYNVRIYGANQMRN